MPETAKKTAAKKASPTGRNAAREVGDKLEEERQERITERDRPKTVWELLAAPFPADELEKLPRNLKARDDNKGRCEETNQGRYYSADGYFCGGWHARSIHLDYVGHAGITMRLNDVLGPDGWEHRPQALDTDGIPIMSRDMFWATLTVTDPETGESVTKMDVAADFNGPQEAWGDSLRRCASRFGVGTYLWSKSERALALKRATDDAPAPPRQERQQERWDAPPDQGQAAPPEQRQEHAPHVQQVYDMLSSLNDAAKAALRAWWGDQASYGRMPDLANIAAVTPEQAAWVEDIVTGILERQQEAAQGPQ